jgi:hypothetical protein
MMTTILAIVVTMLSLLLAGVFSSSLVAVASGHGVVEGYLMACGSRPTDHSGHAASQCYRLDDDNGIVQLVSTGLEARLYRTEASFGTWRIIVPAGTYAVSATSLQSTGLTGSALRPVKVVSGQSIHGVQVVFVLQG